MQVFEDKSRRGVFLEAGYLRKAGLLPRLSERHRAGAGIRIRLEQALCSHIVSTMHTRLRAAYRMPSARVSDSVDVAFVLPLTGGIVLMTSCSSATRSACVGIIPFAVRGLQHLFDRPKPLYAASRAGFLRGEVVRLLVRARKLLSTCRCLAKMRAFLCKPSSSSIFEPVPTSSVRAADIPESRRNVRRFSTFASTSRSAGKSQQPSATARPPLRESPRRNSSQKDMHQRIVRREMKSAGTAPRLGPLRLGMGATARIASLYASAARPRDSAMNDLSAASSGWLSRRYESREIRNGQLFVRVCCLSDMIRIFLVSEMRKRKSAPVPTRKRRH